LGLVGVVLLVLLVVFVVFFFRVVVWVFPDKLARD
jgi:hypothetical protein